MTSWALLIDQYKMDGHLGLTPTFLLGALRRPPGAVVDADQSFAEFERLLESMRDEQPVPNHVARIFECPNLHQPVVTLTVQWVSGRAVPIVGTDHPQATLFAYPKYCPDKEDRFRSLVTTLWTHFRQPICEGRFSYQRRMSTFEPFGKDDFAFIKRALQ